MDSPPVFASPTEESAFWKSQAEDYRRRYDETAEELEEFQISSRELEAELEAQLEQAETKVRELTSAHQRLQMEYDAVIDRNREIQTESHRQINSLADDLGSISKSKEDLYTYVRELEMSNDALENSKRQTISTLEDFEQRLNLALERNAYLENELEEKDQLQGTIQRLKDEARDLRLEMTLKKTRSPSSVSLPLREAPVGGGGGGVGEEEDSRTNASATKEGSGLTSSTAVAPVLNGTHENSSSPSSSRSPSLSTSSVHALGGIPANNINPEALTPTARITALNIVGDLLRKVGSLESKLASCRTTSIGGGLGSPMIEGVVKQRATTIGGGDFSPASFPSARPRANAVSAPTFVNCENYV